MTTSFLVLLKDGYVLLHIVRGAQDHRDSLVDGCGLDVQNIHGSCCGHASCLLYDERHGVAFIQQPELKQNEES